ncbi:MAG: hypothetical protein LBQ61_09185 [Spirochaetales bacterium]|jgi:chromosome segregation ATPase|nr:hypothetical protein [Spirochaetales bacterium]
MLFTVGDFIILAITIIILIIYRQLDRNNRSLDKIRRYAEKMIEELDKFVEGRTVEVKNLGVDLEVHQKTGREILKRIIAAEEDLKGREGEMKLIQDRLDGYDGAVQNLLALTAKVDESLKRLKQEEDYVDAAGKRLKDVQNRFVEIEKSIPAILAGFERQNQAQLEDLRAASFEDIKIKAETLTEEIRFSRDTLEDYNRRLNEVDSRWQGMEEAALERIRREQNSLLEDAQTELTNLRAALEDGLQDTFRRVEAQRREVEGEAVKWEGWFKERAQVHGQDALEAEERINRSFEEAIKKSRDLEDEIFSGLKEYVRAQAGGFEKDIAAFMIAEKQQVAEAHDQARILLGETQSKITEWQGNIEKRLEDQVDKLDGDFAANLSKVRQELDDLIESSTAKIEKLQSETSVSVSGMEDKLNLSLSRVEGQLRNYEEEFTYRLSKMEALWPEIKAMDASLRETMAAQEEAVKRDFAGSREEMQVYITGQHADMQNNIKAMLESIGALEREIEDLKGQSRQGVSEKLRAFEEGFNKDLKQKDEELRRNFDHFTARINQELEQFKEACTAGRESAARDLAEQLKDRLQALQTKTFAQYEKYEEQVTGYQERINQRIGLTERAIEGLEEFLKKEIDDIKSNAQTEFSKSFTEYQTGAETQFKKFEREWEQAQKSQDEKVHENLRALNTGMDSAKSEIALWQNRIQTQMNETEMQVSEKLAQLKAEASETVLTIGKSFGEQKNDFDAFFLDLQKRSKELEMEINSEIKDYRMAAGDMKEKVEGMQQRLFGKIEENYNSLLLNVQEVDKRIKGFLAQSKIFDRADSLKVSLQENIEELKAEITRVVVQTREIREVERKFQTVKKMDDEISAKMARFLTERRRIEEMEGDFKKLINLSQSINIKLDQVTTSYDFLQEVQIRLRSLEDLQEEVEKRHDRLEKKNDVIAAINQEVDLSYQKVQEMEESMRSVEVELRGISPRIGDLTKQIKFINTEHKRTQAAIAQIEKLDDLVADIESRMEKTQKAREWLASAETRIEAIQKKAEEKFNLLGAMIKDGKSRPTVRPVGEGYKDMVVKLARQGWTMEEIANQVNISRGEVELILELKK